jgi:PadR family transcriptional regulator PadR
LTRSLEVIQGTLDLLILRALAVEPTHGSGISARIALMSRDVFQVDQGSLYPALARFEKRGWLDSHWRTTENNRVARFYQLTTEGQHALAEAVASWRRYAGAMELVINAR